MPRRRANKEGSVYRRKSDGRWCGSISVGWTPQGKPKRTTVYGDTQQEVVEKLTRLRADKANGSLVQPTRMTVAEWLSRWLRDYKRLQLRQNTFESYQQIIRTHLVPAFAGVKLQDLRSEHVQEFYTKKAESGLSARTVRLIHTILCAALEQAVQNGSLLRNVTKATVLPRWIKKEAQALTLEEQQRFLKALGKERLGPAFLTALGLGLRRSELLGLRWQDIDLKQRVIHVRQCVVRVKGGLAIEEPKTEKSKRTVPLPDPVVETLRRHRIAQTEKRLKLGPTYQDNDLVFASRLGKPMTPSTLNRRFAQIRKRLKLEGIKPHALRHTFATRLFEENVNAKTVQELLGHSTITTTLDIYSHCLPELKQAAVAKLNEMLRVEKASS